MLPRIRLPLLTRPLTRALQTEHPSVTTPNSPSPSASASPATAEDSNVVPEVKAGGESRHQLPQAPNRTAPWSKSQRPRELAMVGPRFENTIFEQQPMPYSAIELIHQQPVRFSEKRIVVCDGGGYTWLSPPRSVDGLEEGLMYVAAGGAIGGGPLGHPRIFINVDKPEVVPCGYCGLPYAHVHHKDTLVGQTSYPIS